MSTSDQSHRVRISAAPEQSAVIEVDGYDIASSVEAYRITQTVDDGSEVTLYVAKGWNGVRFEGLADVVVEPADVRHVVAEFLNAVDWRKPDEAVLARDDLDGAPGELTRGMLAQLREWALRSARCRPDCTAVAGELVSGRSSTPVVLLRCPWSQGLFGV
ncbi:hypothetical protein [Streptomyces sp. Ac-502]|uniref:hypothetical protein n=1 Tax=Streptomyces sp. Ac-502 TaxID=3342801 RepID=UPI00386228A9